MHRLTICDTCAALGDAAQGAQWATALQARVAQAGLPFEVVTTSCMNVCTKPVSLALQGAGKATYLFGDTKPELDTYDLLALLHLYAAAPDGWIEDARPIGRLRQCLVGRVPAL